MFTSVSVDSSPRSYLITSTKVHCTTPVAHDLSDMLRSILKIGATQPCSFYTEIAPKLSFFSVKRSPTTYGFRAGARAIHYETEICENPMKIT